MERAKGSRQRGRFRAAFTLPAVILAANLMERDFFTVRPKDPLHEKVTRSLPSALLVPELSGNRALDMVTMLTLAGASLETAKLTSTTKELAATALGAQGLASATAAAIERIGWLTPEEREQEDVGISAIAIAWGTKFMLDKMVGAESKKARVLWGIGAVALASVSTVGPYMAKDVIQSNTLDVTAHASGVVAGTVAFALGRRSR